MNAETFYLFAAIIIGTGAFLVLYVYMLRAAHQRGYNQAFRVHERMKSIEAEVNARLKVPDNFGPGMMVLGYTWAQIMQIRYVLEANDIGPDDLAEALDMCRLLNLKKTKKEKKK